MAKTLQSPSVGMIIRQKKPTNVETPLDQIGREKGTSLGREMGTSLISTV